MHMCLGLHFAEMQVKALVHQLLRRSRLVVAPGYAMPYRLAPIADFLDGLPLLPPPVSGQRLEPLAFGIHLRRTLIHADC